MAVSDIPRVLLLLDQGKSAEALELSAKLIEEMPTHVTSFVVHARANESQGRYETAFRSWRQALDLMPNSPQIKKGLLRTADKLARPFNPDYSFLRIAHDAAPVPPSASPVVSGLSVGTPQLRQESDWQEGVEDDQDGGEVPIFLDTDLPRTGVTSELEVTSTFEEFPEDARTRFDLPGAGNEPESQVNAKRDVGSEPDFEPELTTAPSRPPGDSYEPESEDVFSTFRDDSGTDSDPADGAAATSGSDDSMDSAERQDPNDMSNPPADELDSLIVELESARIVPRPDDDPAPAPNLDSNVDDMVSETLAQIFAAQSQYAESARLYEKLAALKPEREHELLAKAAEMRSKIS